MAFCYNHGVEHPNGCPDDLADDSPEQLSMSESSDARTRLSVVPDAKEDLSEGRRLRDQGIAKVTSHTDPAWIARFEAEATRLAQAAVAFTAEDVTNVVGQPENPNAVGARMHALASRGVVKRVGYVQATRKDRHAGVVALWQAP